ncbi:hypothetical protein F941_01541 [Acinetobacter bouvetii DSM 14964 = CIP 107468]|uniref:HEPN/Toprim N-terminal domain-containing protein n=1 Tax=Acinetobacter bouvetii DSM 14964 = CIP 107468 TaxID=1120925 RepID=N9DQ00_9GAMM|nr:HEPN/Toprim-associated domain-containing protein [Acinetobacter bouvetii]ENV82775.1 hypothetical protein F941_01541 [Acinetobacter bouvetii DSM 14964 = CIP 107468]BCU64840.1 hypothetical protein ACBO_16310 [Acinetobacter bouvetii]
MGAYVSTKINNYEVTWSKNYFDEWFFHKNDRIRIVDDNGEISFIGYRVDLQTLKNRLELAGYNIYSAEKELECLIKEWREYFREFIKNNDDLERIKVANSQLQILDKINFDSLLNLIPILINNSEIVDHELALPFKEIITYFDGAFVESLSTLFPTISTENLAIVLIHIENSIGFCEADLTELYLDERMDDFFDIAQVQKQKTYVYETFEQSILDLYKLKNLQINNSIFNNMLLGNAVSAMEAYLFDTFKRQVIDKESIKRRYVEVYDNFNNKANIKPENLFNFLDNLDEKISNEIDRLSFHNIDLVKGLYKNILCCSFENNDINELRRIISQRHDIVHRNGRTLSGDQIQITTESLEICLICISNFIKNIDYQIIDNLLDD